MYLRHDAGSQSLHEVKGKGWYFRAAPMYCEMVHDIIVHEACKPIVSGCTPTNPNVDNLKESAADGPYENASHPENSMPRHSAAFRVVRRPSSRAKHILEQEDVPDNSQLGILSPGKSAAAPRLHHSRRGRILGINQRRLTFDSCSDSKQKATAKDVGSESTDASVSIVQVQGKTNSYVRILHLETC